MQLFVLLLGLAGAVPFATTWKTTQANEIIVFPPISPFPALTISWGDAQTENVTAGPSALVLNHTYASPGLHNVSVDGQFFWTKAGPNTTKEKLVDISNWGDGFLVFNSFSLFEGYPNLQVSASPDSQPFFFRGALLDFMFRNSSFNSSLNWDLTNVTSMTYMFDRAPLNQPITFRNTQGVVSIQGLFQHTPYFNQPFHFDASGLRFTNWVFYNASSFNQIVNLTNSSTTTTWGMFASATSFNQPITFNTSSVTTMFRMFTGAKKFNQPVTFDTSQVTNMDLMFSEAEAFNQPINFNTPKLTTAAAMFSYASSFNQPVVMDTSGLTSMSFMFFNASNFSSTVNFTSTAQIADMNYMFSGTNGFSQDLSSWNTRNVSECIGFCDYCGLPAFLSCTPCPARLTVDQLSVCSTRAPSPTAPSRAPSPAVGTPSTAPPLSTSAANPAAAAAIFPALVWAVLLFLLKL